MRFQGDSAVENAKDCLGKLQPAQYQILFSKELAPGPYSAAHHALGSEIPAAKIFLQEIGGVSVNYSGFQFHHHTEVPYHSEQGTGLASPRQPNTPRSFNIERSHIWGQPLDAVAGTDADLTPVCRAAKTSWPEIPSKVFRRPAQHNPEGSPMPALGPLRRSSLALPGARS